MTAAPAMLEWMTSLADVTRARTLRLVDQYELTVADLCAVLQLPQSTVSRHLKVLADHGWVAVRPDGTSRLYRLAADALDPAARRLWSLLREQTGQTRAAAHDDQRLTGILAARQSRSQAFFSSAAGQWDRLRKEMFGERFDLLALAGLLDDSWVVGDLGCGTGQLSEALAPFVRQVIAVDSSRAMLKAARQRLEPLLTCRAPEIEASQPCPEHRRRRRADPPSSCRPQAQVDLRHGELTALPIDAGTLDVAVMGLVLHHVADPVAVLREAARVVRAGGRLLVIDMVSHDRREYQQQMGHVWLGFDPQQMTDWLHAAGFDRIRVQPLPPAPQAKGPALFAATAQRPVQASPAVHKASTVDRVEKTAARKQRSPSTFNRRPSTPSGEEAHHNSHHGRRKHT